MKIEIVSPESVYITIGKYIYYIDDSTNEQIIEKFLKGEASYTSANNGKVKKRSQTNRRQKENHQHLS